METKLCPKCGQVLAVSEFSPNTRNKSGLASYCKKCINGMHKARYKSCDKARAKRNDEGRRYRLRNKEKMKGYYRKYNLQKFGLSEQQYLQLLQDQDGKCSICRRKERASRNGQKLQLAVDHNHVTGQVRGLLCRDCNIAIGLLDDNVKFLKQAISYLSD